MPAAPFEFFDVRVRRTARISPSFVRVTFAGPRLERFASGGRDQRFKLFLPRPGATDVAVPSHAGTEWWPLWQRMDPAERAVMRSYTVAQQRRAAGEVDIDFALHGDTGVAARWAAAARPGDRATLLGPVEEDNGGVDFRPPADTDVTLLAGDVTALPAIAGILAWLPAGSRARAWIEVTHPDDRRELPTRADAEVTWLPAGRPDALLEAVRESAFPAGQPYAWVAGEAGTVRQLRRHLVNERGIDRRRVTFTGYWRRGAAEDDLLAEAIATAEAQAAAAA